RPHRSGCPVWCREYCEDSYSCESAPSAYHQSGGPLGRDPEWVGRSNVAVDVASEPARAFFSDAPAASGPYGTLQGCALPGQDDTDGRGAAAELSLGGGFAHSDHVTPIEPSTSSEPWALAVSLSAEPFTTVIAAGSCWSAQVSPADVFRSSLPPRVALT